MKFFTSAIAIALATVAFAVPAHADGSNWSVVGAWGSSDVTIAHGQGGKNGGMLTLVGDSDKVNIVGIQTNDSKNNLQGTLIYNSFKVGVTTLQGGKNNTAGTLVVASDKTSVYTEQSSNGNLSLVGVIDSDDVDVTVIQGPLTVSATPQ